MITPISAHLPTRLPLIAQGEAPKTSTCRKVMLVFSMFLTAAVVAAAFAIHLIAGAVALVPAFFAIRAAYRALSIKDAPTGPTETDWVIKAVGDPEVNERTERFKRDLGTIDKTKLVDAKICTFAGARYDVPVQGKLTDGNRVLSFSCTVEEETDEVVCVTENSDANAKWEIVYAGPKFKALVADYSECGASGLVKALICPILEKRGEEITFKGKTKEWKSRVALHSFDYAALSKKCVQLTGIKTEEDLAKAIAKQTGITADRMYGTLENGKRFLCVRYFTERHLVRNNDRDFTSRVAHWSEPGVLCVIQDSEKWNSWQGVESRYESGGYHKGLDRLRRTKMDFELFKTLMDGEEIYHLKTETDTYFEKGYDEGYNLCVVLGSKGKITSLPGKMTRQEAIAPGLRSGSIADQMKPPIELDEILKQIDGDSNCRTVERGHYGSDDPESHMSLSWLRDTLEFGVALSLQVPGRPLHSAVYPFVARFENGRPSSWVAQNDEWQLNLLDVKALFFALGIDYAQVLTNKDMLKLLNIVFQAPNRVFNAKGSDGITWQLRMSPKNGSRADLQAEYLHVKNQEELQKRLGSEPPAYRTIAYFPDGKVGRVFTYKRRDAADAERTVVCAIMEKDGTYTFIQGKEKLEEDRRSYYDSYWSVDSVEAAFDKLWKRGFMGVHGSCQVVTRESDAPPLS
jgi:hypothetical protein